MDLVWSTTTSNKQLKILYNKSAAQKCIPGGDLQYRYKKAIFWTILQILPIKSNGIIIAINEYKEYHLVSSTDLRLGQERGTLTFVSATKAPSSLGAARGWTNYLFSSEELSSCNVGAWSQPTARPSASQHMRIDANGKLGEWYFFFTQ